MIIRCAKPSINGLIARWKSRGKIETLTGLFRGLYSEADQNLNGLARADTDTESA
jgi:hypothetical protein